MWIERTAGRSDSLQDLGNIGDYLGGMGVVITLIYLARQIRQNTDTVRA